MLSELLVRSIVLDELRKERVASYLKQQRVNDKIDRLELSISELDNLLFNKTEFKTKLEKMQKTCLINTESQINALHAKQMAKFDEHVKSHDLTQKQINSIQEEVSRELQFRYDAKLSDLDTKLQKEIKSSAVSQDDVTTMVLLSTCLLMLMAISPFKF